MERPRRHLKGKISHKKTALPDKDPAKQPQPELPKKDSDSPQREVAKKQTSAAARHASAPVKPTAQVPSHPAKARSPKTAETPKVSTPIAPEAPKKKPATAAKRAGEKPAPRTAPPPKPAPPAKTAKKTGESIVQKIVRTFRGRAAREEKSELKAERKKSRARIFRSIESRTRIPMLIAAAVIVMVFALMALFKSGDTDRLLDDLNLFVVPKNVGDFTVGSKPAVNAVIARGPAIVPLLLERYPKMNYTQRVAVIHILGELPDPKSVPTLKGAIVSGDKILMGFAVLSAAKIGDSIIGPFLSDLGQKTEEQQDCFLEAIAKVGSKAAEDSLLKLSKDGVPASRKIVAAKLVDFADSSACIGRLWEMAQEAESLPIADQALLSLEILLKKAKLRGEAENLAKDIALKWRKFESDPGAVSQRARLLCLMGIAGAIENMPARYVNEFKGNLQSAFVKGAPKEIAGAAYGLGTIRDVEFIDRLIGGLAHPDAGVTEKIADALIQIDSPDTLNKLLAQKELTRSREPHVILALARLFEKFYPVAVQDELTPQVSALLTELSKNASGEVAPVVTKTLALYQTEG